MAREEMVFPIQTTGGRIQNLRKEKGYDRATFHALIYPNDSLSNDSRQKTVHNWESGKTSPDYETLRKMCSLLDCDSDYLLCMQETPRKATIDIQNATGLSASAADILRSMQSSAHRAAILSGLIESSHFSELLESLESAIKCKEPACIKFVNEYANSMQALIRNFEKASGTSIIDEYTPNTMLRLKDSSFDETMSFLSEVAPNLTALSRNDAVKFFLQEAQHSFRQAAEDAI